MGYSSALRATFSAAVLLAGIGFVSTAQAETCSISFTVIKAGLVVGGQGGSGRIIDADPALGGPFQVLWNLGPDTTGLPGYRAVPAQPQGYWDINLEFC